MNDSIKITSLNRKTIPTPQGGARFAIRNEINKDLIDALILNIDSFLTEFNKEKNSFDFSYFPIRINHKNVTPKSSLLSNNLLLSKKDLRKFAHVTINENKTHEIIVIKTDKLQDELEMINSDLNELSLIWKNEYNMTSTYGELTSTERKEKNKKIRDKILRDLKEKNININKTRLQRLLLAVDTVEKFYISNEKLNDSSKQVRYLMLEDTHDEMIKKLGLDYSFFPKLGINVINNIEIEQKLNTNPKKHIIFSEVIDIEEEIDLTKSEYHSKDGEYIDFDLPKDIDSLPVVGVIDSEYYGEGKVSNLVSQHKVYASCSNSCKVFEEHGTKISNLIAANDKINQDLIDDCGFIRVKHFKICTVCQDTQKNLMKIYQIVKDHHREIKVWNFSFNVKAIVRKQNISFAGEVLDRIQKEFSVLIIVGVGNYDKSKDENNHLYMLSDSTLSLTIAGVTRDGKHDKSTRKGYDDYWNSFIIKPDLAYYSQNIKTINLLGNQAVDTSGGVSFASALISRKAAFIAKYVTNYPFNPYLLKSILINAASSQQFSSKNFFTPYIGFGICPIKIDDVVSSKDNQIKVFFEDTIKDHQELYFELPLPIQAEFYYKPIVTLSYESDLSPELGVFYIDHNIFPKMGFKDTVSKKVNTIDLKTTWHKNPNNSKREKQQNIDFSKYKVIKNKTSKFSNRGRKYKINEEKLFSIILKKESRKKSKTKRENKFAVCITFHHAKDENLYTNFITRLTTQQDTIHYSKISLKNNIKLQNQLDEKMQLE